jgi:hypothetical protein
MGGVLAVAGAIVICVPIPFWRNTIALDAVAGVNLALMVITIAVSASYDISMRWAAATPRPSGLIVASLLVPKILLGGAAATLAASLQAIVFLWLRGGEGTEVLAFLGGFFALAIYCLVVLLPWSLVARLSLGRIAGPWAVLALAIAASGLSRDVVSSPIRLAGWVVPWLPSASSHPESLGAGATWLYAVVHAGAVGAVAASLLRRAR